ncbi:MAG: amidohydrolase family protein [Armatimonadetes bacterium]|nr:amidohydrolase family protein [Armatimonadota bacterium]
MSSQRPIIDANTICGFWARRQTDISPDTLARLMQQAGVARYLTVSTTAIFYDFRAGNDETLALGQKHPGLVPVATVDPRQYIDCLAEVEKRAQQGFLLFRLFPELQGYPLDFAPLHDILAKLNELNRPVMITTAKLGDATQLADMIALHQTPVIMTDVNYLNLGEAICVMKAHTHLYLETHLLNSPDAIEVLTSEVGADRLIFGSYSPLRYFSSSYLSVSAATITEEQKTQVLVGNIRNLLSAKS